MNSRRQLGNGCCRFVEVVDRLAKCPCDSIPPILTGPPCPFKRIPGQLSTIESMVQRPRTPDCPLREIPTGGQDSCVFLRPQPIDFKGLPRFSCDCRPGTCPELAKNFIRSLGFDPLCACPCSHAVKPSVSAPVEITDHKRGKKDKLKSTHDTSKIDVEKPTSGGPGVDSLTLTSSRATEKLTTELPSDPVGAPASVQSGAAAGGFVPITSKTEETTESQLANEKPEYTANSGSGSVYLTGKGFKIFEIDGEKVLFNYSTKNCSLLKCKCSTKDQDSCGCTDWARLTKYKNCVCPGARKIKRNTPTLQLTDSPSTPLRGRTVSIRTD